MTTIINYIKDNIELISTTAVLLVGTVTTLTLTIKSKISTAKLEKLNTYIQNEINLIEKEFSVSSDKLGEVKLEIVVAQTLQYAKEIKVSTTEAEVRKLINNYVKLHNEFAAYQSTKIDG